MLAKKLTGALALYYKLATICFNMDLVLLFISSHLEILVIQYIFQVIISCIVSVDLFKTDLFMSSIHLHC